MGEHKLPKSSRRITNIVKLLHEFGNNKKLGQSNVPCDGCTKCCRAKGLQIEITEEESKTLRHTIKDGVPYLEKIDDRDCVYLIDDKCSIYNSRPQTCRAFDCRTWVILRRVPLTNTDILAIVQQWELKPKTDEDLAILLALNKASELGMRAEEIGTGTHKEHLAKWTAYLPEMRYAVKHDIMIKSSWKPKRNPLQC